MTDRGDGAELRGVVDSQHHRIADGQSSALVLDLPLSATRGAADRIKNFGHMRVFNIGRDPQAPDGNLAIGRLDVTISNPDKLLSQDSGPWNRIKGGLSVGLTALSWSLTFVVVGLCFVVPIGGIYLLVRKFYQKSKAAIPPRQARIAAWVRCCSRSWRVSLALRLTEPTTKLLAACAGRKSPACT